MNQTSTPLMDSGAVERTVARMAREIVERSGGDGSVALMGIHRRGIQIAELLGREIETATGSRPPQGSIDITLYRDDLMAVAALPEVGETELPEGGIDGRTIILVDDVLFTGRTIRAALNELMDWGRPGRVLLAVLIDRGGRELPIQPDVVGRRIELLPDQRVDVRVPAIDGRLGVDLGGRG